MAEQPEPSRFGMHPTLSWLEEAARHLEKKGIPEKRYQNAIAKERVLKSIAFVYWLALMERVREQHRTGPQVKDHVEWVGDQLGVNRTTSYRWLAGESLPSMDKVFGTTVLVLRREIHELRWPTNRQVLCRAVSRTLGLIRAEDCGGDERGPSRDEFACVWLAGRHPHADSVLSKSKSAEKDKLLIDVLNELGRRFPKTSVAGTRDVSRLITEWRLPYSLFLLGLIHGWGFVDVEPE